MKRFLAIFLGLTILFSFPLAAEAASVGKVTGVKISATTSNSVSLKWKKVKKASGYQIYYSTKKNKGFKKVKTVKKGSTVKAKITKLSASKTYYFKIRAYRGKANGKLSKVISAKTKAKPANTPIIPIYAGKTYYYDLNRDGKNDTITVKRISDYGNPSGATAVRDIYVNGSKAIRASGYKDVNLWIYTLNKQSVVISQAVAGTGGTEVSYYYYNSGKYTQTSLSLDNHPFYFQNITYSGNNFVVIYTPKYNWYSTFDSMKSFGSEWPFEVIQNYSLVSGKFNKVTEYPTVRGKTQYVANSSFTTSKSVSNPMKNDGVKVNKGAAVTLLNVYYDGEFYYFRIKSGNSYGWFKGSSSITLTAK